MDEINPYATPRSSPMKPTAALPPYYKWAHIAYAIAVLLFSLLVMLGGRNAGDWTQLVSCLILSFL